MNAILLAAALSAGQLPVVPVAPPERKAPGNIEARKEARDRLLVGLGREALPFLKATGDRGIAALQSVSPETGKKLVKLFDEGHMAKWKSVSPVLDAIRANGDAHAEAVGAWVALHHTELEDPDAIALFCASPLEIVYEMQDLRLRAEEARASRKVAPPWLSNSLPAEPNVLHIVIAVLFVLLLASLLWKRKPAAQ
jgi:hypothetical protein